MSEVFDNDLTNYQNKLHQDDQEALNDHTIECDLFNKTSCCSASFWNGTDICNNCKEHADPTCSDCEDYDLCNNVNRQ